MASSNRLRHIPSFLTPRLDSKKPVPAERPASEMEAYTYIYVWREKDTRNDIYISTQTLPNKICP